MIDGRNFLDQPIKNNWRAHDNMWKIDTGHSHDYITGCLLDYPYFQKSNCNRFKQIKN